MWWIILLNSGLIFFNLLLIHGVIKRGDKVWWFNWFLVAFLALTVILNLYKGVTDGYKHFEGTNDKATAVVQDFRV